MSQRCVAGQQPKRQRLTTSSPDVPRAQQLMAQYLDGGLPEPPWEAMGLSKAPVIGGKFCQDCFHPASSLTICRLYIVVDMLWTTTSSSFARCKKV